MLKELTRVLKELTRVLKKLTRVLKELTWAPREPRVREEPGEMAEAQEGVRRHSRRPPLCVQTQLETSRFVNLRMSIM